METAISGGIPKLVQKSGSHRCGVLPAGGKTGRGYLPQKTLNVAAKTNPDRHFAERSCGLILRS